MPQKSSKLQQLSKKYTLEYCEKLLELDSRGVARLYYVSQTGKQFDGSRLGRKKKKSKAASA